MAGAFLWTDLLLKRKSLSEIVAVAKVKSATMSQVKFDAGASSEIKSIHRHSIPIRTDSLFCGKATAVATVHRTVAKSRLSNPSSKYPYQTKNTSLNGWCFGLVGEDGFEPSKRYAADLQSVPFGHSGNPPYSYLLPSAWSR